MQIALDTSGAKDVLATIELDQIKTGKELKSVISNNQAFELAAWAKSAGRSMPELENQSDSGHFGDLLGTLSDLDRLGPLLMSAISSVPPVDNSSDLKDWVENLAAAAKERSDVPDGMLNEALEMIKAAVLGLRDEKSDWLDTDDNTGGGWVKLTLSDRPN
jgi:hypothetical protein